jgi:hypothetical protein
MTPQKADEISDAVDEAIRARSEVNPWSWDDAEEDWTYDPDVELLAQLIGIPIAEGASSESGRLAKSVDAWVAHELRRSGFGEDEVWPRLTKPRVLPREVGMFINGLPKKLRADMWKRVLRTPSVAPANANVLGRAYVKQVDVVIAQWARGPELLVSTKTMVSSFRKNLPNRFEEAYGDAKNLRGRYPMASIGFMFVVRSTALEVAGTVERAADMLRKLREEEDVYDAACMVLAEWDEDHFDGVRLRENVVPDDVGPEQFMEALVFAVLERSPVDMHVEVRERLRHQDLPLDERVDEGETPDEDSDD